MKKFVTAIGILSILLSSPAQAEIYTVIRKIKTPSWPGSLTLSHDGQSIAYCLGEPGFNPKDKNGYVKTCEKGSVCLNGVKISPDNVYTPLACETIISPNGNKVAFSGTTDCKEWSVWINDKIVSLRFECVVPRTFSSDGSKIAYEATKDFKMWSIWINDKKVSLEFPRVQFPVIGPNGSSVAYIAYNSLRQCSLWVNDKKVSVEFNHMFPNIFYDGTTCAYAGLNAGKVSLWINDKKISIELEDSYGALGGGSILSPKAGKIAFSGYGRTGSRYMVINGMEVAKPEFKGKDWTLEAFNPDGNGIAYRVSNLEHTKWSVWVDNRKASLEFDAITFAKEYFTKTGKLIFAGYDKTKSEILVMQQN